MIGSKAACDASVAIKWYVPEPESQKAVAVRNATPQRLAPELLLAELGNILWKKTRRGELTAAAASAIATTIASACPVTLYPMAPLLHAALDIATTYDRTVYDALYIALALAESCPMVTADQRLVQGLANTPLAAHLRLLSTL